MRIAAAMTVLAACAAEPAPGPDLPRPLDAIWAKTVHAGDLVALVPGTGAYDYLAAPIEPLAGPEPLVDVRAISKVAGDAIVFEQAIAAAHRAGVDPETLTFGLWGAGFTKLQAFDYLSYEGVKIRVEILGGTNSCAVGTVLDNLLEYTLENAAKDAADLDRDIVAWRAAHPGAESIVASHSWGGAVAEYLAFHGGTSRFTIAAGVPAYVPSYGFAGPGLRDVGAASLYEVDRPDDPVHAMNPSGDPDGHQYDILFGDDFQGSYGVTTDALSCRGIPGPCP
jgi:hypothetical protein